MSDLNIPATSRGTSGNKRDRTCLLLNKHPVRIRFTKGQTVVSSTIATPDDDRELRHVCSGDGADHLRAVLRDAALLRLRADHVAGDVDEEK